MQCHAVPQPPPISGRSPEKELCFRTKQEREKHQDSVCVCVCVCVCVRARACTRTYGYTHMYAQASEQAGRTRRYLISAQ